MQWKSYKSLCLHYDDMVILYYGYFIIFLTLYYGYLPWIELSLCLANVTKITRRIKNKIDTITVLIMNGILRRRKFNFVNRIK